VGDSVTSVQRKTSLFSGERATQVAIAFSRIKLPLAVVRNCLLTMGPSQVADSNHASLSVDVLEIIGEQLAPQTADVVVLTPYMMSLGLLIEVSKCSSLCLSACPSMIALLACSLIVSWQCSHKFRVLRLARMQCHYEFLSC